jgi:hypothetical protein
MLWVGLGTPCDEVDMGLLYASTTITIGNGKITPFRDYVRKPQNIASLIFVASTRRKWNVDQATHTNAWIDKLKMNINLTIPRLREIVLLWTKLNGVNLREVVEGSISWNLPANRE